MEAASIMTAPFKSVLPFSIGLFPPSGFACYPGLKAGDAEYFFQGKPRRSSPVHADGLENPAQAVFPGQQAYPMISAISDWHSSTTSLILPSHSLRPVITKRK